MLNRIDRFIRQHRLLSPDGLQLVAVSGGADSVCLLLVLHALGYRVEAVHCNFHLRGDESNRDEAFVKTLCERLAVRLHVAHFDTACYAELHQVSIEMAARTLRYGYFEQLRADIGAEEVCVAHHRDDSVETVLINLLRGTGIHGLTGIKPRRNHIVRPLLCVSRQEILSWLESRQQPFVTDSSNLVPDIVRNQLRINVLPLLRQLVPAASDNILATARRLSEAALVYDVAMDKTLERLKKNDSMSISQLLSEPSPESVLFEWLTPMSFTPATIEGIAHSLQRTASGRLWTSSTHQLTVTRGCLVVEPLQSALPVMRMPETGAYVYLGGQQKFRVSLVDGAVVKRESHLACMDARCVAFPLTVRPVKTGDRFQPLGMEAGTRLVSDFLTDRHLSLFEKRRTLVLTDASGNIVWLVDQRPDHRFRVTDETRSTLIVEHIVGDESHA